MFLLINQRLPPRTLSSLPGTAAPLHGAAAPPLGTVVPPLGTAVPPLGTVAPPLSTVAPPLSTVAPPLGTAALPLNWKKKDPTSLVFRPCRSRLQISCLRLRSNRKKQQLTQGPFFSATATGFCL